MITVKIHTEKESILLQKLKSLVDLSLSAMQVYRPPALMFTFRMAICSREEKMETQQTDAFEGYTTVCGRRREGSREGKSATGGCGRTYIHTRPSFSQKTVYRDCTTGGCGGTHIHTRPSLSQKTVYGDYTCTWS